MRLMTDRSGYLALVQADSQGTKCYFSILFWWIDVVMAVLGKVAREDGYRTVCAPVELRGEKVG